MLFALQYALIVGGYAATAFLLGNYMKEYTGARDIDLGFIFMIQPAVIVVRPFVCSFADRHQSHRSLYLYCAIISVLTHIPFILIPFITQNKLLLDFYDLKSTQRLYFWTLVGCHFIGCICFCCMRTLGDVLTVNYCKRINSNYTQYRRYGPISFGVCSLILGYINTSDPSKQSIIPDYVPGFILYTGCHFILALLFYLWPPQFFVIHSDAQLANQGDIVGLKTTRNFNSLPSNQETWQHVRHKLSQLLPFKRLFKKSQEMSRQEVSSKQIELSPNSVDLLPRPVDCKQQMRIMLLLMRQDSRIPLLLLILTFCGIVGHSIQNFVYVYLHSLCAANQQKAEQHCNSSTISGYIMAGICITETVAYTLSSWLARGSATKKTTTSNKLVKIQLALITIALHYLVLAYLVRMSPYYFLVESAHGFEFGLMVATSIECGDFFANQVDAIIPELRRRSIVAPHDDLDLVRVSLVATMIACFLLVYDGLGGVLGSLMYGLVVNHFGYPIAFKLNAGLATALLLCITCGSLLISRYVRHNTTNSQEQQSESKSINENTDSQATVA